MRIEGDKYMEILATSFGGSASVPAVLEGTCSCATCVALEVKASTKVLLVDSLANAEVKLPEYHGLVPEERVHDAVISVRHPHLQTLRVIIVGLVCLWIVIAMVFGRS